MSSADWQLLNEEKIAQLSAGASWQQYDEAKKKAQRSRVQKIVIEQLAPNLAPYKGSGVRFLFESGPKVKGVVTAPRPWIFDRPRWQGSFVVRSPLSTVGSLKRAMYLLVCTVLSTHPVSAQDERNETISACYDQVPWCDLEENILRHIADHWGASNSPKVPEVTIPETVQPS